MERRDKIIQIVQTASRKPLTVQPDDSLFDGGFLDSFALSEVVDALEREFSLNIPDSDLNPRKFETISKIEAYLDSRS